MKQQSPLRKGDKHFDAIYAHVNKPAPAKIDADRRKTDKCDCADPSQCWEPCGEAHVGVIPKEKESNPLRQVAQAFVGGMGVGAAVTAVIFGFVGANPLPYALGVVMCLLGYLYLDSE